MFLMVALVSGILMVALVSGMNAVDRRTRHPAMFVLLLGAHLRVDACVDAVWPSPICLCFLQWSV